MPFTLSTASRTRLLGAHPLLQQLFAAVALRSNVTILDSQRGRAAQELAFRQGHSRAHFGQSAHNWNPAIALDVAPYPIDWNNIARFKALGAMVTTEAKARGTPISWGGTWKSLKDYPHYELDPWRQWAAKCKPYLG